MHVRIILKKSFLQAEDVPRPIGIQTTMLSLIAKRDYLLSKEILPVLILTGYNNMWCLQVAGT